MRRHVLTWELNPRGIWDLYHRASDGFSVFLPFLTYHYYRNGTDVWNKP